MNRFLSTRRLLCIFGTRLSFILMKLQTRQGPLGPVFMISSKNVVLRSQYAKILVEELKIIRKRYESIPLNQETALYFWYKIIIHPDEATDSSVYSGACFHYFLSKCISNWGYTVKKSMAQNSIYTKHDHSQSLIFSFSTKLTLF